MDQGIFTIDWKDFKEASTKRFKAILARDDFSDVTLVSGDGQRLPAHQVILATGCSFFKNLLEGETANQRPIIFLRGVAGNLLAPLLEFLYTGRVQVSEQLIADFLVLAEELGIEGLANSSDKDKDIVEEAPALVDVDVNVSGLTVNPKIEIQDDLDRDPSGEEATNLKSEKNTPTRIKVERKHNRALKVCHSCNKPFNDASNFRRHIRKCPSGLLKDRRVVMELARRRSDGFFHCQYCGKEVKDRSNMKRHIRKSHSTQISQTTTA